MNGTGLVLYFYHGHLYGYVSTNKTWKIDVDYKVEVNKWHTYQMSWSESITVLYWWSSLIRFTAILIVKPV
jgi:hypothetical protein